MGSSNDKKKDAPAALILAGGNSARMESPKPWLAYNAELTFLHRIIQLYHEAEITDIVVVINTEFCGEPWSKQLNSIKDLCKLIPNDRPEKGRMHSIRLGSSELNTDTVFIHNVDSPYLNAPTLRFLLIGHKADKDVTIPVYNEVKGHPVVIGAQVIKKIITDHHAFGTLKDALADYPHDLVQVDDRHILTNVNTMAEYRRLKIEYPR